MVHNNHPWRNLRASIVITTGIEPIQSSVYSLPLPVFIKHLQATKYRCGIHTNLQEKVWINVNCVRNIEIKVHGFGPRTSHTGPVRSPMMIGGKDASSEQSTPM